MRVCSAVNQSVILAHSLSIRHDNFFPAYSSISLSSCHAAGSVCPLSGSSILHVCGQRATASGMRTQSEQERLARPAIHANGMEMPATEQRRGNFGGHTLMASQTFVRTSIGLYDTDQTLERHFIESKSIFETHGSSSP